MDGDVFVGKLALFTERIGQTAVLLSALKDGKIKLDQEFPEIKGQKPVMSLEIEELLQEDTKVLVSDTKEQGVVDTVETTPLNVFTEIHEQK